MTPRFYRFTIIHHGYSLVLRLNDAIIDTDPRGAFKNRSSMCNQYIIDGRNTLSLDISLAGEPPAMPKDLALKYMIHELTESDLASNNTPEPLLSLEFPGKEVPSFPARIEGGFDVASPFGKWEWESADRPEMTPENAAEITGLLEKLHQALADKNLDAVVDIVKIKTLDLARSFYIDTNERLADQKNFFTRIFSDSQFAMPQLKTDDIEIIPMADSRLFMVQHASGGAAIESAELSEGYCFSLPVIVSRISGKWQVVR
jgi:hypothetical protein